MRLFKVLIVSSFLTAETAVYFYLQNNQNPLGSEVPAIEIIREIKEDFRSKFKPALRFNLEELKLSRSNKDLVDPKMGLPHTFRYPFDEVSTISKYAENCDENGEKTIGNLDMKKAYQWHRFICGHLSNLPDGFFSGRPYMHPSGESYVWLALHSGKVPFTDPEWIRKHSSGLHILEVTQEKSLGGLGFKLSSWDLLNLLNGANFVLSNSHVFFEVKSKNSNQSTAIFDGYLRSDWNQFVKSSKWIPNESLNSSDCFIQEGNICWTGNRALDSLRTRLIVLLLFAALSTVVIFVVLEFVRRLRRKKVDIAQRLFTLQMLTHELRTPATSLRLSMESLRKEFDALPMDSQKAFLRMCDDLQRLDRVVDASKMYLSADGHNKKVDPFRLIPTSVNTFVSDIVERFGIKVSFTSLAEDVSFKMDPYWVEMCIRNLIENAITHGQSSVIVNVKMESNNLLISVVDKGNCMFATLDEMSKPFVKNGQSHGLGLGLAIVVKTLKGMGGQLTYSINPTTFTIRLKGSS